MRFITRRGFLVLVLGLFVTPVWGQGVIPNDPGRGAFLNQLRRDGKLVSVTLVPEDKKMELYVVGKKQADAGVYKGHVKARIVRPPPGRNLRVIRQGDHYIIEESAPREPTDIQVTAGDGDQAESFRFHLQDVGH